MATNQGFGKIIPLAFVKNILNKIAINAKFNFFHDTEGCP